ncbi:hypothetical protein ACJX0J_011870, partial [Zea mays]
HNSGSGAKTGDAQKCQIHRVADKCSSLSGRWLRAHGPTSVVLAGLLATLKMVRGTLTEQTYLFLSAGECFRLLAGLSSALNKRTKTMPMCGVDFKWYDGFFLSMLATSV